MKFVLIPIVAAISIASFIRESNSHAAAKRGQDAFAKKDYPAAAREYAAAQQQAPSPRGFFNLGTSQVAGRDRANGAQALTEASKDPGLRSDALYNRGNGALDAKQYEAAIRDYADALRANPGHAAAKRNLEIALNRLTNEQQQQSGGGGQQQQPNPQQQQQQPQQNPKPAPKEGETDAESILRSVQQQEQEEMRRMKGRAAVGRVGW
jgi:Ca-activated chloride channel homolog